MSDVNAKLDLMLKDAYGTINGEHTERTLKDTADRHARHLIWVIDRYREQISKPVTEPLSLVPPFCSNPPPPDEL